MKRWWIIGVILTISILLMVFVYGLSNHRFYEAFVVQKSNHSIHTLGGDSYKEAKAYYEQADIPGGVIYTDISGRKMKKIEVGQKVRVLSSTSLNASSPSRSKANFVQIID
ncbi:MAG TPA: DUF3221 domain-containing protein [Chondromyces sp.]|nr:DUF3221 domain-containing protein [Chondromyces sp.]